MVPLVVFGDGQVYARTCSSWLVVQVLASSLAIIPTEPSLCGHPCW